MEQTMRTPSQVKREVKKIQRNHKLFIQGKNGESRRLDKISQSIYGNIVLAFIKGDAAEHYSKRNAGVKTIQAISPLEMNIHENEQKDYEEIKKVVGSNEVIIYYNNNWRPLVKLGGYSPKVKEVSEELETAK